MERIVVSKVSTSLSFASGTEEAFIFYRSVFGGEFTGLMRWSEMPEMPGQPPIRDENIDKIMHIELKILGGHTLMGGDAPESMQSKMVAGNNVQITLEPDTKEEANRIFAALSKGGTVQMPMADMFWGGYYGALTDKFGINWMINVTPPR